MTDIEYNERSVKIKGTTVTLPDPPQKHVEVDETIVLLIDTLAKSNLTRNVWGLSPDGTVRWKVEEGGPPDGKSHPYTGLTMKDGDVWVYNWDGHIYRIDLEDGQTLEKKYVK
jgi:outer membrane protein assembly factor BamB